MNSKKLIKYWTNEIPNTEYDSIEDATRAAESKDSSILSIKIENIVDSLIESNKISIMGVSFLVIGRRRFTIYPYIRNKKYRLTFNPPSLEVIKIHNDSGVIHREKLCYNILDAEIKKGTFK